jgi:hypothetical protein
MKIKDKDEDEPPSCVAPHEIFVAAFAAPSISTAFLLTSF